MVANLLDHGKPEENRLVAAGKRLNPHAYDRAAKDRVGAKRTLIVSAAREEFGQIPHWGSGTYGTHLANLLKTEFRIDAVYRTQGPKGTLRRVSRKRPVIALVLWEGGGGHWVCVSQRTTRGLGRASKYTVLDPSGYVVTNRGSTNYADHDSNRAVFASHFVEVKGNLPPAPRGRKLPGM